MACLKGPATLPDCKLKCLCSAQREISDPAHLWTEEINILLPKAGEVMFFKIEDLCFPTASSSLFCLLTLIPPCFFLSDSPGIQTMTRWLLWDISLPSSQSGGFPNKAVFLASTPCLLDSLACSVTSRVSLDLVTEVCMSVGSLAEPHITLSQRFLNTH